MMPEADVVDIVDGVVEDIDEMVSVGTGNFQGFQIGWGYQNRFSTHARLGIASKQEDKDLEENRPHPIITYTLLEINIYM